MLDVGSSKGSLINMNGSLGEEGDTLANMDGAWTKNRKMTDWEMPAQGRQRKISHRKVIIHDDGEICNRTFFICRSMCKYLLTCLSSHNYKKYYCIFTKKKNIRKLQGVAGSQFRRQKPHLKRHEVLIRSCF